MSSLSSFWPCHLRLTGSSSAFDAWRFLDFAGMVFFFAGTVCGGLNEVQWLGGSNEVGCGGKTSGNKANVFGKLSERAGREGI